LSAERPPSTGANTGPVIVILRTGLIASTTLITAGLLVALLTGDHRLNDLTIGTALTGGSLDQRLVLLGVLALVATPIFEVFGLIAIWTHQHDWRFVAVGAAIVAILSLVAIVG